MHNTVATPTRTQTILVSRAHAAHGHTKAADRIGNGCQRFSDSWSKLQQLNFVARRIDLMHKWRRFNYSFVYIQISPTSLILGNIFF